MLRLNYCSFRILLVFALILGAFATLMTHVYEIMIVRHAELVEKARDTYTARKRLQGQRGLIYDRNGNLLVGNIACQDISAEPGQMCPKPKRVKGKAKEAAAEPPVDVLRRVPPQEVAEQVASLLAEKLDLDREVLLRRLLSGAVEVPVKSGVDIATANAIRALNLPGLVYRSGTRRVYPKDSLLATVLGFTNSANQGVYGLEQTWNTELNPRRGAWIYERDRKGRPLYHQSPAEIARRFNGNDLYLTIDEPLQTLVETELAALGLEFRPKRAFAIMADPRNGAILAIAQWPSYNPNERDHMDPDIWRNHLASDVFDPGSIMKGIAVAGALDYGVVTLNSKFDCEDGRWFFAGKLLRDADHKYGLLTVAEIIQKSSNIGTAKIAIERLGTERLYQTLRRFGFGERTGCGLPDESPGIMRPPRRWDGLTISRYPIGQGISVTGLQMVQAYCAIANGGIMPQLHLVDRVRNPNEEAPVLLSPPPRRQVARPAAIRDITTALSLVTEEGGTAKNVALEGYKIAGKTGTAQKLVDGSYENRKYVSSFIGFVPADNPVFVLLVTADEPSSGKYYGGTVSGPAFRRISDQTLRYLNIPPTEPIPDKSASATRGGASPARPAVTAVARRD